MKRMGQPRLCAALSEFSRRRRGRNLVGRTSFRHLDTSQVNRRDANRDSKVQKKPLRRSITANLTEVELCMLVFLRAASPTSRRT
jgi:hypothetical protein